MKNDDEIQNIKNENGIIIENFRKDIKFKIIALNLSGQREKLEQKAAELIDKKGLIGALKKSR